MNPFEGIPLAIEARLAEGLNKPGHIVMVTIQPPADEIWLPGNDGAALLLEITAGEALAQTAAADALLEAVAQFLEDEADNRSAAGSEHSDYEREPRELAERVRAAMTAREAAP